MVAHLSRALDVLEAEGVRFTDSGVYLQRHLCSWVDGLIMKQSSHPGLGDVS
jgi:hypothetical protein